MARRYGKGLLRRFQNGVVLPLLGAVLAGCAASSGAPPPPSGNVGTRLDGRVSPRILDLPLRDSQGRVRKLVDFTGKVVVISDGMTLCQEACPVDTAGVVQTARAVDAAGLGTQVQFLTITVDPQRDTPGRLAAYRKLFAPVPRNWMTLTGSPGQVARLWKYFGVYAQRVPQDTPPPTDWLTGKPMTYDVQHSDEVFFLSRNQHERFILEGIPHIDHRAGVPDRIYGFMNAQGHHNVHQASDWTVPQALQVVGWLLGQRVT